MFESLSWAAGQLILLMVSLLANGLSAMAGGGAGLLQLPALIVLGLPFATALATHKVASVALGVGASIKHARAGVLEWRFALFVLAAGLPGVVAGAHLVLMLPERLAVLLLGILTMALAVYSLVKRTLGQVNQPKHRDWRGMLVGALLLFVIGFLNGSLTSGTGSFVTICLVAWFGLDFKRAVAYTMILVGFFWNGTGALALAVQAPVAWPWLPALLIGSLIGGYLGAVLAVRYGNRLIKRLFEFVTLAAGLVLIAKAYHG